MKVEDWVVSVREVIDQEIKGSYLLICHSLGAFVGLVRLKPLKNGQLNDECLSEVFLLVN